MNPLKGKCAILLIAFFFYLAFYDDKISGVETSVLNYDIAKILILLSKQAVKAVNIYAWVFKMRGVLNLMLQSYCMCSVD